MIEFLKFVWDMILETAVEFAAIVVIAVVICVLALTITNSRIKTGAKTLVFLTASEMLACFIGWLSWQCYRMDNLFGAVVGGIVAAAMAIGFIVLAIHGHRSDWKR